MAGTWRGAEAKSRMQNQGAFIQGVIIIWLQAETCYRSTSSRKHMVTYCRFSAPFRRIRPDLFSLSRNLLLLAPIRLEAWCASAPASSTSSALSPVSLTLSLHTMTANFFFNLILHIYSSGSNFGVLDQYGQVILVYHLFVQYDGP